MITWDEFSNDCPMRESYKAQARYYIDDGELEIHNGCKLLTKHCGRELCPLWYARTKGVDNA